MKNKTITDILALAFTECKEAIEREDCNERCRYCGHLTDAVKGILNIVKEKVDEAE